MKPFALLSADNNARADTPKLVLNRHSAIAELEVQIVAALIATPGPSSADSTSEIKS
jgi:hypothetical protein